MKKSLLFVALFVFSSPSYADSEVEQLKKLIEQLSTKVNLLTEKVNELENKTSKNSNFDSLPSKVKPQRVVLEIDETPTVIADTPSHVLSNPWWNNIDISGFAAVGAYSTGSDGLKEHWGFEIKEASLFIDAAVWENIDFFLELQTNRLGSDASKFTRTGEVYLHIRDIELGDSEVGLKLGRIDVPFGEEYLWQDAIDNPLIQNSASYPYGWDEGVLIYGQYNNVNWIFSITDGTDERSKEDHEDKAFNAKFYGDINEDLYLSFSMMKNGKAKKSALEFAGSHFEPVDGSNSSFVDSWLAEFNIKYQLPINSNDAYIAVTLGTAQQDDNTPGFDRDLHWFTIEPYMSINEQWYSVLRYSEIGTYSDDLGYHFDGKSFAGGNAAYGYDVERFRRLSVGMGWLPTPRTRVKFEIGKDWFDLIDSSVRDTADDRGFVAAEFAVGF